jgi:hypothetical protein
MTERELCNQALEDLARHFTREEMKEMWKSVRDEPVPEWAESLAREMLLQMSTRFSFIPITLQSLKAREPEDTTPFPPPEKKK